MGRVFPFQMGLALGFSRFTLSITRTEVRSQKSEVRSQRSEVRNLYFVTTRAVVGFVLATALRFKAWVVSVDLMVLEEGRRRVVPQACGSCICDPARYAGYSFTL